MGIDLGTTSSSVAVLENGQPRLVESADGGYRTPSVVAFDDDGGWVVGAAAVHRAVARPESAVSGAKRLLGIRAGELPDGVPPLPYRVVAGAGGDVRAEVGGRQYSAVEISAMILERLVADAERHLGERVDAAVVTVPAYFNDAQRQAVKEAGSIAGLEVRRLINETSAAALASGLVLGSERDETIAAVSLGGGTLSVSILEVGAGIFDVKSTAGSNRLGATDFDVLVTRWLAAELDVELGVDPFVTAALLSAASDARVALTAAEETEVVLPLLVRGAGGVERARKRLSRSGWDVLTEPCRARIAGPLEQALTDAREGLEGGLRDGLDRVLVHGGLLEMAAIEAVVLDTIGRGVPVMRQAADAPAIGAAVQAGVMAGDIKDLLLLDVIPLTLGIETKGGVMTKLIERNTTIPTRKSEVFSTAEDNQTSVEVHLLQGERERASGNATLGKFQLTGIPPAPRGVPQIEVGFDIDIDGILAVTARDLSSGAEQGVEANGGMGLSDAELTALVAKHVTMRSRRDLAPAPARQADEEALAPHAPTRDVPVPPVKDRSGATPARPDGGTGIEVFYSYSHHDERLREQLETHLSLLRRQGLIEEWHDRLIDPGDGWESEIDAAIRRAEIVLLLVSPNFMDSDYCYDRELEVALERHERGEAQVIPIILRPVDWMSGPFGHLQALPTDAKPVIEWGRRDRAWLDVSSGLRKVVTEFLRAKDGHRRAETGTSPS